MKMVRLKTAVLSVIFLVVAFIQAATAQDFSITIEPGSLTLVPGESASFVVSLTPANGFNSSVALTASNLTSGVTASFSPQNLTPPGTSLLTLTATTNAVIGTFNMEVSATGGRITHTAFSSVSVNSGLLPVCYGAFQGTVTDSQTGLPVPYAVVTAEYSYYYSVTANASGQYLITNVDLGSSENLPLNYSITASQSNYWSSSTNAYAVCDATNTVNLQILRQQEGSISGTLIAEGGQPLTNVTVYADGESYAATNTDSSGHFQFQSLLLDNNNVSADYEVYAEPSGYWEPYTNTIVQANSNSVVSLVAIPICYGTLTGSVLYSNTGLPATNINVTIYTYVNSYGYVYYYPTTDINGDYTVTNIELNEYNTAITPTIYTSPTGYNESYTNVTLSNCNQTVSAGALQLVPTAVPPPVTNNYGALTGHVYDLQTGLPITNAYIYFSDEEYYQYVDTNGAYLITNILVGTGTTTNGFFYIYAYADNYFESYSNVVINANQTATQDFRLLRTGYGYVAGTVVDSSTGLPVSGAYVSIAEQYTGTNGQYASGPLSLNSGNVPTYESFYASDTGYWTTYTNTTITNGLTNVVNIDLIKVCTGATIFGSVINAQTEHPVTNATIEVYDPNYGYLYAYTDTNGNYIITNLTAGTDNTPVQTTVYATATGFNTQEKEVTLFCDAAIRVDFGPPTGVGAIDGYVTNVLTGQPLSNVFIGSGFGGSATTDVNGYYILPNAPLGPLGASRTWTVTAAPLGYPSQTESVLVISNVTSRLDFGFGQAPTDLFISATGVPSSVVVGSNLYYTITLSNGTANAGDVSLTDILPPGVVFSSATVPVNPGGAFGSPTLTNGQVTIFATNFGSNSMAELLITVIPTTPGILTNTAGVTTITPPLNPATTNLIVTVTNVVTARGGYADVGVSMTVMPNPGLTGNPLTYTLLVTNSGPSSAPGVVLADSLPSYVEFFGVTLSQGDYSLNDDGSLQWNIGNLDNQGIAAATIVILPEQTGLFTNSATVSITPTAPPVTDPNPANNYAVAITAVNTDNSTLINFDSLDTSESLSVTGAILSNYLANYGVGLTNISAGTSVAVENQASIAGGGFVFASSPPNVLTQIGSNGPASFTVSFANLLSQFSFTRPELLANPTVTHPAWIAQAFDALGNLLDSISAPVISSSGNVPPQIYTLTGGGIASVQFSSAGTGWTTFNAVLLDDFILTPATSEGLPPAVLITAPTNGQVVTNATISLSADAVTEFETVTNVAFYYGNTLAGSTQSSPFSATWNNVTNGTYVLTAVAFNSLGLTSTSAPVSITVASGFAFATSPLSQTIGVSNNATFSVTTTGTPASYQWQFNGTNVSGATQSSYMVSNAPLSASGIYTVVAVNNGQSITSAPATLTVLGPPTLGPISIVTNGSDIVLSVSASDSVPFYYKWELNGNGIPGATNGNLNGTAIISYTITNAEPFDSGDYQVVVANIVASENSPVFDVALSFAAPTTNNDSFDSSLAIGPLTNGIGVSGISGNSGSGPAVIAGKPAGGYLWYNWTASFTGVMSLTTRGSSFDTLLGVYTGSTAATLTSVAEDDDSGGFFTSLVTFNCEAGTNYQIVVAGYKGATGNVVLAMSPGAARGLPGPAGGYSIGGPEPVITQQPSNQIVHAGDTLTLGVSATGAMGYQWYIADVAEAGDVPVAGGTNSDMVIGSFTTNGVGNYYVEVSNAGGDVQSAMASVEIAAESQNGQAVTPKTLFVDKFGDAVDLTGASTTTRYRPASSGGETGGYTLSQSFSTSGATKEEGEPNHAGQPGGASYWYSYTAPIGGTIQFSTVGSTFNTILAVYTGPGTSFSTLTSVGSAYTTNYVQQGQPTVVISNVVAGIRYFIAIDGYLGASGAANLTITLNPAAVTVNTNIPPLINSQTIVTIISPANNFLTASSNITIKGVITGVGGLRPIGTNLQITVNTNAAVPGNIGNSVSTPVVIENNGFAEEVAQESYPWSINATLVPGANTITAQVAIPQNADLEIASLPVTRTIFYDATPPSPLVRAPLTLETSGNGKIRGIANRASLEIGKVYKVTAVPLGNWMFTNWMSGTNATNLSAVATYNAALDFLMVSNLILQANFVTNPFTPYAGLYNGLFSPTNGVTEESSGFFTATLPGASHGAYSAKLLLDGGSYPFSGMFNLSGQSAITLARPGKTPITVALQLTNEVQIIGNISDYSSNGWTSILEADRAVFNAQSNPATNYNGRYTLIIPPGSNAPVLSPGGYGYAMLSNNWAGRVTLSGRLGDGTAISQSVPISTNGDIPFYVSLYSRQGSLLGWLTLTNNPTNHPAQTILGTNLSWIKRYSHAGTIYAAGFTNTNITVLGSHYAASDISNLANLTLAISNGNTALVYSNLTLTDNKLGNQGAAGNPSDSLEGVVTPGTGLLTVTFRANGADSPTVARGVVLQENQTTNTIGATNAAGWFLDGSQSGWFLLQQQ